jgi:hypothetical protein
VAVGSNIVPGVMLTQFLPFADPDTLTIYGVFERTAHAALRPA